MFLKCGKTGKLFFTQEEATKHAEEIGAANFEEVAQDAMLIVDAETKRKIFWSMDEVTRFKQRTREPNFEVVEISIKEYKQKIEEHELRFLNDPIVINYAKKKIVDALVEVKAHGPVRVEKACWFTQNKGISEAEAWLEEHKNDEDLNKPLRLPKGTTGPPGTEGDNGPAPMDVDQEGDGGQGGNDKGMDATATENGEFVKNKVEKKFVDELLEMGFSLLRAEKALFFTDSVAVQNAVQWLGDHENDETLDWGIVRDLSVLQAPAKPKMSKEEAEKAGIELQQKLKREREAKEKQEAKDREKARVESHKMMQETNEKMKEDQKKHAIWERQKQEEEQAKHKAELKERLRLDYIDRFGKEPPSKDEQALDDIKSKPTSKQLLFWINKLKTNHPKDGKLKLCVKTLGMYAKNIHENPMEKKFQTIKKDGKAYTDRIAMFSPEAQEILRCMGLKDEVDTNIFAIGNGENKNIQIDTFLLSEAVKFLGLVENQCA